MSETVWLITATFAALAVLGFLHMLASAVKHETKIHNLRVEVVEARNRYVRHMRGDDEIGGVDIVEDDEPEDGDQTPAEPGPEASDTPAQPAAAA